MYWLVNGTGLRCGPRDHRDRHQLYCRAQRPQRAVLACRFLKMVSIST